MSPEPSQGLDPKAERAARRRSLRDDAFNLPNLLTSARIVMIPLVLVLLDRGGPRDCYWAAWVYAAAAITDFFDGYIARRQGLVSVLGKFLDPLADKLIVMATLVWLVNMGRIETWVVVLLLGREFSITGLRSIASSEGVIIAAGDDGKAKTAFQMIGILCLIIGYPYRLDFILFGLGEVDLVHVGKALVYLSLFYSLTSGAEYVRLFADAVDAKERRLNTTELSPHESPPPRVGEHPGADDPRA